MLLEYQTKHISGLLPKIARNLQVAHFPVGKLSRELAISFPSVSGIVDRLHKEKLLEKSSSNRDHRLVLVKLTNTGKDIVERLLKVPDGILSKDSGNKGISQLKPTKISKNDFIN